MGAEAPKIKFSKDQMMEGFKLPNRYNRRFALKKNLKVGIGTQTPKAKGKGGTTRKRFRTG
ncbi:MAG: hypothetical protein CM15mP65_01420 [Crocinitomicaceae bacterium]|nr:MAG: hypothetical protein CM15mP65_01420 [Crocinitomicaceae bacterium]